MHLVLIIKFSFTVMHDMKKLYECHTHFFLSDWVNLNFLGLTIGKGRKYKTKIPEVTKEATTAIMGSHMSVAYEITEHDILCHIFTANEYLLFRRNKMDFRYFGYSFLNWIFKKFLERRYKHIYFRIMTMYSNKHWKQCVMHRLLHTFQY